MDTPITSFNSIAGHVFGTTAFSADAAAWSGSYNGATGTRTIPAGPPNSIMSVSGMLNDPGLTSDQISEVTIDFDWVLVADANVQMTLFGSTVWSGSPEIVQVGSGSGHGTFTLMGAMWAGPTIDRATLFATSISSEWVAALLSGTSGNFQLTLSNWTFTVTDAGVVAVNGVLPDHGSWEGGTLVTVTGGPFAGTPTVRFGGVPATQVTVLDSGSLTCRTPTHPGGAGQVEVTVS